MSELGVRGQLMPTLMDLLKNIIMAGVQWVWFIFPRRVGLLINTLFTSWCCYMSFTVPAEKMGARLFTELWNQMCLRSWGWEPEVPVTLPTLLHLPHTSWLPLQKECQWSEPGVSSSGGCSVNINCDRLSAENEWTSRLGKLRWQCQFWQEKPNDQVN